MVACLFVNEWESMQVQNSFNLWLNSNLHVTYGIFEKLFDIEQYLSKYMYIYVSLNDSEFIVLNFLMYNGVSR